MLQPAYDYRSAMTFAEAEDEQKRLHTAVLDGSGGETLIFTEHPHTFSLGRRTRREHVLWDELTLARRKVAVCRTDRAGGATYHGPGQLVVYAVVDLRPDLPVRRFVSALEEAMAGTARALGVECHIRQEAPGLWTEAGKIGSVGLRIERGVSRGGMALNVDCDTSYFEGIIICRDEAAKATSLSELTGGQRMEEVRELLADALRRQLDELREDLAQRR